MPLAHAMRLCTRDNTKFFQAPGTSEPGDALWRLAGQETEQVSDAHSCDTPCALAGAPAALSAPVGRLASRWGSSRACPPGSKVILAGAGSGDSAKFAH